MTEYKNQHYVPRSYLRHFSKDGVGLCRYSLANEASERSNIEKTCASFYFYVDRSASEEWETTFSHLETKHAEIIQKILADRSLTIFSANANDDQDSLQDFLLLCNFILLTATRTNLKKKEIHEIINLIFDIMKPGIAQSEEARARGITEEALDRFELRRDTANLESMEKALVDAPLISDLATRLLINETEKPFIASDSPTVFYNFLKLADLSMIGWQSPGLMLFLPLSEEIMLWLSDSQMYKPNTKMGEQTLSLKKSIKTSMN